MYQRDIGSIVKQYALVAPQALSAGATTGSSVDRQNSGNLLSSGKFFIQTGAATGTPTTISVTGKVKHSDDGSTWSDFTRDGAAVTISAITAANSTGYVNVPLEGAKRYVTLEVTVAFTGGSSPTILVSSSAGLGGASREPV